MLRRSLRGLSGDRQFTTLKVILSAIITSGLGLLFSFGIELARIVPPAEVFGDEMSVVANADAPVANDQTAVVVSAKEPVGEKGVGSLVICGGGALPEEVRRRFLELAGGPDAKLIVIPTANSIADSPEQAARSLEVWKQMGVTAVQLLHTRSRDRANDPEFAKPLAEATGVWFGGGRQSALADVYLDTEVERQLKALSARGGVIGGSSAGAAVMTRLMIAGGRTDPVEARGFDFLPGSVIDQHFLKRKRVERLLKLLTRYPELIGFGIDEGTALVVNGDQISVLGASYVMACLPASKDLPPRQVILKRGDRLKLGSLRDQTSEDLATLLEQTAVLASSLNLDLILPQSSK